VGTYRSNEVADDHEIFCLAQRLKSFGVPTTMLSLEGLNPKDLNTMISDALCIFPRISEPLSDIVYQKTKGNPFFVLAFMESLVDRGLLEYNISTRIWVWDEDDVSSMDITGNVLHLLSSKMSGLSTSIQSALKIAACFGIKIEQSIVAALSTDPEHSTIQDKFEQVVKEGFMIKVGTSDFKFVHDKVREAAYSLIPEKDMDQVSRGVERL
jgi:predicted ATPase